MEAEQRREQRREAVSETAQAEAAGKGWWEACAADNMHTVSSVAEFKQHMKQARSQNKLIVTKYFAPWCHACRSLYPKLQQLARQNSEVLFIKVNAGEPELHKLCEQLGVDRLPYFHFYKGEEGLVSQFAANLTPSKLAKLRAEIARHKEPALASLGRTVSGELQGALSALKRSASTDLLDAMGSLSRQASGDLQAA
ncbi:hypothetical protein WJX72_012322 [[Myrmecia] bisecta]|uniref:Thioredoxin domain-containing protein n=1 Tax=[Myrmecia] bisecta TaxID=41462 RepID=A0AAW1Q252_9CHLO